MTTQHKQIAAIYSQELTGQSLAYTKDDNTALLYHAARLDILKQVIRELYGITSTELLERVYP